MKNSYKTLPALPGVYLFKDASGTIIYVGKAKSLKSRVASYFRNTTDWKIQGLLSEAASIDHILTNTETEALLLEAQLVQEHLPKFNVLLKSGQPYVYLLVTKTTPAELLIVRNKTKKGVYFGPFIHKQQARNILTFLTNTFVLSRCNKKIDNGCLDYHLGRCAGTCLKQFDEKEYALRILLAQDVLRFDHKGFLEKLTTKIQEYTKTLEFEKARNLHNYQKDIEIIFATLKAKYSDEKYLTEIVATDVSLEAAENYEETATELQAFLQLTTPPMTIDCFDISHFQGHFIVGSCVRFTQGKPDKRKFRHFKIRTLSEQNDCAALQEIVSRRYKNPEDLPDLVLIDGGKGQRNAVLPLLPATCCVSLAKREELLFSAVHPEGTPLYIHSRIGKLLICLRDYAHHFAISYHKLLRSKNMKGPHL